MRARWPEHGPCQGRRGPRPCASRGVRQPLAGGRAARPTAVVRGGCWQGRTRGVVSAHPAFCAPAPERGRDRQGRQPAQGRARQESGTSDHGWAFSVDGESMQGTGRARAVRDGRLAWGDGLLARQQGCRRLLRLTQQSAGEQWPGDAAGRVAQCSVRRLLRCCAALRRVSVPRPGGRAPPSRRCRSPASGSPSRAGSSSALPGRRYRPRSAWA